MIIGAATSYHNRLQRQSNNIHSKLNSIDLPKYAHFFLLSDTMGSVLRLCIHHWVPITVVMKNKVQAELASDMAKGVCVFQTKKERKKINCKTFMDDKIFKRSQMDRTKPKQHQHTLSIPKHQKTQEKQKNYHTYLSKMITVSAVAKLMPSPPARVLSKKIKC